MSFAPGTRVGPYEIVAPIGAGGMGEVYRAKDTHLDRAVAIKVLPESFALDADRVARFTREAKTLAALNHPNIGAIYGLEKTTDFSALVMELVEGRDLSEIIAAGSEDPALHRSGVAPGLQTRGLSLADALPIARQIADALEAAHEQGIWAFGAVLYEMLSGTRAFEGAEISDVLAAVLRHDIDFNALPISTPPRLRALLGRCPPRCPRRRIA